MTQPNLTPDTSPAGYLPHSTILIVDDNPQNVELLQAFLESLPVKIITAADGVRPPTIRTPPRLMPSGVKSFFLTRPVISIIWPW